MAHKAGLILGQISLTDFRQLERLKVTDMDAYERMERRLGTTKIQLIRKYGRKAFDLAVENPVRSKHDLLKKEGYPERQAEAIAYSYGRYVKFGTRKDKRRYLKR